MNRPVETVARPSGTLSIDAARGLFPGAEGQTYLDVSARGLIAAPVRAAIDAYLDMRMRGGDKPAMFALLERARAAFAGLIHARPDEVAAAKNVSEGLNTIANAIDWRRGDNVVLCPDIEHANNVYPWLNVARRHGIEVRALPMRGGAYPVAEMAAAVDARTRVITVCHASYAPGLRTDLAPLAQAARRRDALLLVDGAQSVGQLETDVEALGIDALAVSTQKGLLALYGMGWLYVSGRWAERLAPAYLARFGVDLGDAGEAALGDAAFRLADGARRFDVGNYNYIGAAAAEAAAAILAGVGVPAIERHVVALGRRLAGGLAELGLPLIGSVDGPDRAHIVMIGALGDGHDAADDRAMQSLYQHLAANGVRLSVRRGALRFSIHLYNTAADVDRVLALCADWQRARRGA